MKERNKKKVEHALMKNVDLISDETIKAKIQEKIESRTRGKMEEDKEEESEDEDEQVELIKNRRPTKKAAKKKAAELMLD